MRLKKKRDSRTSGSWTDSTSNAHSLAARVQNCTGWPLKPLQQELAAASPRDHTQWKIISKGRSRFHLEERIGTPVMSNDDCCHYFLLLNKCPWQHYS